MSRCLESDLPILRAAAMLDGCSSIRQHRKTLALTFGKELWRESHSVTLLPDAHHGWGFKERVTRTYTEATFPCLLAAVIGLNQRGAESRNESWS